MLAQAVIRHALATVGTRETARNSGPEIDAWLANVHAKPGDAWCMAWAWSMYQLACDECRLPNMVPRTAGSLRCWQLAGDVYKQHDPTPGSVVVFAHLDRDGEQDGFGHVGIVTAVNGAEVTTCEGNTNAAGSRNGDCVAEHTWNWKRGQRGNLALVGFLRFEMET